MRAVGEQQCVLDHLMKDCDYYSTSPTSDDITSMNDIVIRWPKAEADMMMKLFLA